MEKPRDTAGIVPFFLNKDGKIVYVTTTETNRLIDKRYIEEQAGPKAAALVPDEYIMYMPAKGKIEIGETSYQTAVREAAEEMGYNVTEQPIITSKGQPVEPNGTWIKSFGKRQKKINHGMRGIYSVTLFIEQIHEGSFTPKQPVLKTERSIIQRTGNQFLGDGGALVTLDEMLNSLEPLKKLTQHPDVKANKCLHEFLSSSLKSRSEQIRMVSAIETKIKHELALDVLDKGNIERTKNSR